MASSIVEEQQPAGVEVEAMYGSSMAERGQEEKNALLGHEPRHTLDVSVMVLLQR